MTCNHISISDVSFGAESTTPTSFSPLRSFVYVTSLAREKGPIPVAEKQTHHGTQRQRSDSKDCDDRLSGIKEMKGTNNTRPSFFGPPSLCMLVFPSQSPKLEVKQLMFLGVYSDMFNSYSLCFPLVSPIWRLSGVGCWDGADRRRVVEVALRRTVVRPEDV